MKKIILFAILILVLASLLAVGFFYWRMPEVNYLITGVSYYGFYNFWSQRIDSNIITSVMEVLGYWGDKRITLADLQKQFPIPKDLSTDPISIYQIKKFFEDNGYKTSVWVSAKPGDEISEIKKFVNQDKKIPVIVYQERSLDDQSKTKNYRVVIGLFDQDKKIVVHDFYWGNNFELSYEEFNKYFNDHTRAILAVWPSKEISGQISGPNSNFSYSPRIEAMDKLGKLLTNEITSATVAAIFYNDFEKSSVLSETVINSPDFEYFPLAFQVDYMVSLAKTYIKLEKIDKTIDLLNNRVLPINHDLKKLPLNWEPQILQNEQIHPYYLLAQAYLKKNLKDLALVNYKKAKLVKERIEKEFPGSTSWWQPIQELEK